MRKRVKYKRLQNTLDQMKAMRIELSLPDNTVIASSTIEKLYLATIYAGGNWHMELIDNLRDQAVFRMRMEIPPK